MQALKLRTEKGKEDENRIAKVWGADMMPLPAAAGYGGWLALEEPQRQELKPGEPEPGKGAGRYYMGIG